MLNTGLMLSYLNNKRFTQNNFQFQNRSNINLTFDFLENNNMADEPFTHWLIIILSFLFIAHKQLLLSLFTGTNMSHVISQKWHGHS